jgi:aspartate racemase
MKTIGLLGGMSWESSQIYYRELNQQINQHLSGLHSAQIVMISVDFAPIEQLMVQGDWSAINQLLIKHCLQLQAAGADFIVIATNTMHKCAPTIEQALDIPLLHIAEAVGQAAISRGFETVGLLGTSFTMEQDFYTSKLKTDVGIETLIPNTEDRRMVNRVIFEELCQGQFTASSKQHYLSVINDLAAQGAEAIILGCTEIGLLVQQQDTSVILIDATHEHIKLAVKHALF